MSPAVKSAIDSLQLQHGSCGLDAGCGPGGLLSSLNSTLKSVQIVGLDLSEPHLYAASRQIELLNLERVNLVLSNLWEPLPFSDNSFDWVWCADVLWPDLFNNQEIIIKEFKRITRPHGIIALFFADWLRAKLLPGYTDIERKLTAAIELKYYSEMTQKASIHYENALQWLIKEGLTDAEVSVFFVIYRYPLDPQVKKYLVEVLFNTEYGEGLKDYALSVGMSTAEWEKWSDLSNPSSKRFLLDQESYYCVKYGTLVKGRVPESKTKFHASF